MYFSFRRFFASIPCTPAIGWSCTHHRVWKTRRAAGSESRFLLPASYSQPFLPMTPAKNTDLRLAVLIDADNVPAKAIHGMISEIANYGKPTIKRIYGDFSSNR